MLVVRKNGRKMFFNILGGFIYILGILANLDNVMSVTLGVIGVGYAVVKLFTAIDNQMIKRIHRKKEQAEYKKYLEDKKNEREK